MTSDISQVIQLVVAPVFLLAGIGAFINAFAMRLGRIFDRSRLLEDEFATCESGKRAAIETELQSLRRRAKAAYTGIALDILAALLVCLLIATAFVEHLFGFEIEGVISGLFIAAMLSLIGGLMGFLQEVFIAVQNLAMGLPGSVAGRKKNRLTVRTHHHEEDPGRFVVPLVSTAMMGEFVGARRQEKIKEKNVEAVGVLVNK